MVLRGLEQIANPQVANFQGAFQQGFGQARQRGLQDLAMQTAMQDRQAQMDEQAAKQQRLGGYQQAIESGDQGAIDKMTRTMAVTDPDAVAKAQQIFQNMDARKIQSTFLNVVAAAGSTENQDLFLQKALENAPQGTPARTLLEEIIKMPPEQRQAPLFRLVEFGSKIGALPKGEKAEARTDLQKDISAAGFEEGTPEFKEQIKKSLMLKGQTPLVKNLLSSGLEIGTPEFQAAIKKAITNPEGKGEKDLFTQAYKIRGEITKASDSFNKITDSFGRITASAKDPSAAGDLALIFNFMKMLDPGSVVRESEFATAANAAGVPDRLRNQYNKLLRGERLAPNQRADFIGRSQSIFDEATTRNKKTVDDFVRLGERFGLSRDDIVIERGQPEPIVGGQVINFDAEGNIIQ